jgi:hypothetical protein
MSNVFPIRPEDEHPDDEVIRSNVAAIRTARLCGKYVTMRNELGRPTRAFGPDALDSAVEAALRQYPNETAWLDGGSHVHSFNPAGEKGKAYLERMTAPKAAPPPPDDDPTPPSPSSPRTPPSWVAEPAPAAGPASVAEDDGRDCVGGTAQAEPAVGPATPPWRRPSPEPKTETPKPEPEPQAKSEPEPEAQTEALDDEAEAQTEHEQPEPEPDKSHPGARWQGVADPVDLWRQFDPPELPRGVLPQFLERFAVEQAEQMGLDCGGLAMCALVICGTVIRDRIKLKVKRHDSWCEAARLWCALVGPPSTKKSPMIDRAAEPVCEIDARLRREYHQKKDIYDALPKRTRQSPRNRSAISFASKISRWRLRKKF